MKLIKPYFEIWEQPAGLEGVYKQIERVGRVCYKSEDKITEGSAKPFVDRMIKSGHGAMLEHGTVYLKLETVKSAIHPLDKYYHNKYSKVCTEEGLTKQTKIVFVTTNLRVLIENGWMSDLQYLCEPTEFHEKRITVHFVCDRGVSHEFVRHRVMSFAQESTRYCNYSKDKFDNQVTFVIPNWCNSLIEGSEQKYFTFEINRDEIVFMDALQNAQNSYLSLLKLGWKPQEARAVLPNSLKTELVVTGFTSDWNHFFDLRARGTTGAPHPQAKELAEPLMREFVTRLQGSILITKKKDYGY